MKPNFDAEQAPVRRLSLFEGPEDEAGSDTVVAPQADTQVVPATTTAILTHRGANAPMEFWARYRSNFGVGRSN